MGTANDKNLSDFDRMKAFRNAGSYFVLLLALGAMTFFGVCDPQSGGVRLSGAAASVGGEKIDGAEFRRYYNYYLRTLSNSQENFNPAEFGLANQLLDMFINTRIAYIMAERNGFVVSDAEIHDLLLHNEQFLDKDGKFSAENFKNFLKFNGYTENSYLAEQRRALSVQRMESQLSSAYYFPNQEAKWEYWLAESKYNVDYVRLQANRLKLKISDKEIADFLANETTNAEVKTYYETNKSDYETPDERKARHILISFKGARNAAGEGANRTKEAAMERAQKILKQVNTKGASFADIAKKETDEPNGKTSGGDLGWFDRSRMVPEFSDAAFALEKGQISGVIESPFGYHIIKVEDVREAKTTTLEEAQNTIAKTLIENKRRADFASELAKQLMDNVGNEKEFNSLLKANDLKWESTGEFAANTNYLPALGGDQRLKDAVFSLQKKGDVYKEPVKVGESYFIVKLNSRTSPNIAQLSDDKLDELKMFGKMRAARQIFSAIKDSEEAHLKEKIWKNPDYLALDNPRNNS